MPSPYPAVMASARSSGWESDMDFITEVDAAHFRVGGDLSRRAHAENSAGDQHRDALRKPEHQIDIVLDEQYRDIVGQTGDHREDLPALLLRNAGRRFVEQQDFRPRG